MSAGIIASAAGHVVVEAVRWPPCVCGRPWTAHKPTGVKCGGYTPVRPVQQLGTRAYKHPDRWCRLFWRLEVRLQGWRERRETRLKTKEN